MTFKGLATRLILMVDLKTVRKWKSPRSSSGFASQSVRLDSNTSLDCEHEISPSDTHHRQAERDKIASALSAGNQSVEPTRWRWCFTPLYAALFCLSHLLIRLSVQVLTAAAWMQKAALIKSQTFYFLEIRIQISTGAKLRASATRLKQSKSSALWKKKKRDGWKLKTQKRNCIQGCAREHWVHSGVTTNVLLAEMASVWGNWKPYWKRQTTASCQLQRNNVLWKKKTHHGGRR